MAQDRTQAPRPIDRSNLTGFWLARARFKAQRCIDDSTLGVLMSIGAVSVFDDYVRVNDEEAVRASSAAHRLLRG
jgi:hypothetical protein